MMMNLGSDAHKNILKVSNREERIEDKERTVKYIY